MVTINKVHYSLWNLLSFDWGEDASYQGGYGRCFAALQIKGRGCDIFATFCFRYLSEFCHRSPRKK